MPDTPPLALEARLAAAYRAPASVPLPILVALVVSVVADAAKVAPPVLVQTIDGGAVIVQSPDTNANIWFGVSVFGTPADMATIFSVPVGDVMAAKPKT